VGSICFVSGGDVPELFDAIEEVLDETGIWARGFPNFYMIGSLTQASVAVNYPHIATEQAAHAAEMIGTRIRTWRAAVARRVSTRRSTPPFPTANARPAISTMKTIRMLASSK